MTPDLIILLIIGAMIGGFVQGLSGFAFGLVAVSFWVWGFEPRMVAVMAVFGSLSGQLLAAVSLRRSLQLTTLLPFLAGGLVGIPLGVAVLPQLNPHLFKLLIGLVLMVWCPSMLFAQHLPKVTYGGRIADSLAGVGGGFLGGIGGFTGLVPILWCTLRGFEKERQRAVIQNFNVATLSVTLIAYLATGIITRDMVPMLLIVAAALLVPVLLGARIYIGLSEIAFRRTVLTLLSLSGAFMVMTSLPRVLE